MIARILLAIVLVLGALPVAVAMPTCHEAAAPADSHATMPMDQHEAPSKSRPAGHGDAMCVGCIAPTTLHRARVAPPILIAASPEPMPGGIDRANSDSTPEPPPPRV